MLSFHDGTKRGQKADLRKNKDVKISDKMEGRWQKLISCLAVGKKVVNADFSRKR